jgi:polyhydroxybutyrate depolymerase
MKSVLVVAWLALGAGVLLACGGEVRTGEVEQYVSSDGAPQWQEKTLVSSGIQRRYLVLAPLVHGNPKLPLLISMHGWSWTPELHVGALGWAESFVKANDVIVAFPEGVGSSWNAGSCCPPASGPQQIDDVQFIAKLIDDVAASYRLDRARVYASGLSNGAAMAYRVACERPDLIAAVGSVAGTVRVPCAPGRPVPIIEIHGEGDLLSPYYGGLDMFGNPLPSIAETMGVWANNNSCLPGADKKTTFAGTDVTCEQFRACKDDAIVELCTVHGADGIGGGGGGHNWPGAAIDLYQTNPALYFWWGYQTNEIAAHEVIWNFVKRYHQPPAAE